MDNHELRYNGKIATRHLGQLVAPGQIVLVSAYHAVSMHGQRGWESIDIKKAKLEVSQIAKTVSIEPNVNIGDVDKTIDAKVEPIIDALIVPGPAVNAAATDTVVSNGSVNSADTSDDHTTDTEANKFPCTKCTDKFPSKRKLQIHMNIVHVTNASNSSLV
jgi:hypothetical protein